MDLSGKTVLITGAAGRIGSATARMALASGADLVLVDIDVERLAILNSELTELSSQEVHSFPCDITSSIGINQLFAWLGRSFLAITSAVHCAYPTSAGWGAKFEELIEENLHQDLHMQLGGAILFSQKVLGYFLEQGGGELVHISSVQGVQAPKFDHYDGTHMTSPVEYAAIKSGIISITRWLSKYYANKGIRVNCVSPGGIMDNQPEVFLERYRQSCTNIGMLDSDHIANAIVFLLSPTSKAINGQNLIVDDGWSL